MIFCRLPWQCTPLWISLFGDTKSCSSPLKQIKKGLFKLSLAGMTHCPPHHCRDRNVVGWTWLCVPYGVRRLSRRGSQMSSVSCADSVSPSLQFSGSLFCCHDFTAFAPSLPTSGNTRTCVEAQRFVCLLPARLSEGDALTGRGVCVKWEGKRQMKQRGDRERGRQCEGTQPTDCKGGQNSTGALATVHHRLYFCRRISYIKIKCCFWCFQHVFVAFFYDGRHL